MKARNPRHGSMQFWPRKRARRVYPKVRSWASSKDAKPLGFAGYKVGMTQIQYTDGRKTSTTKGLDIVKPVTIIECPPIKVKGARAYKKSFYGTKVVAETISDTKDKHFSRKISAHDKKKAKVPTLDKIEVSAVDKVYLMCYTQPSATKIGKKKPEVFEIAIGGSVEEQLAYAKDIVGKEISVADTFEAGQFIDAHSVTTGKGYQGVIKRFGVALKVAKSEKGQRRVGARSGGWTSQAHMMYRVAQPGQQGFHTRTDYNKQILSIDSDTSKINPKGGIPRYGEVSTTYILVAGSVPGPKKRLIRLTKAIRPAVEKADVAKIDYISTESVQG